MIRRPPRSTLFPSAPLFRSREEPQAPNPPEGAILYYSLAVKPSAHITVDVLDARGDVVRHLTRDRKSTRLNSSHSQISYAVFCLKKKKQPVRQHSHRFEVFR